MIVAGKAVGRKKPLFAEWSIPTPPELREGERVTLRDVLSHIVRTEVAAFHQRQSDRQFLKILTEREIAAGAELGKITMGQSEVALQEVDEDEAVATALQAFEDGLFLVILDEQEHRDLEAPVYLQADTRITFVRLTLLAGG